MILGDGFSLRSQFYEDWAVLMDEEKNSILPTVARGLGSILFAINIDNADFDRNVNQSAGIDIHVQKQSSDPLPVVVASSVNSSMDRKKQPKRLPRVNVVSLDDDDFSDTDSFCAHSAPPTCLSSPDAQNSENRSSNESPITEARNELVLPQIDSSTNEDLTIGSNITLTPIGGENVTISAFAEDDLSVESISLNTKNEDTSKELSETAALYELRESLKKYEDKIDKLELQIELGRKENDVLKMQLKKYIAAVQMLNTNDGKHLKELNEKGKEEDFSKKFDHSPSSYLYYHEASEYERKLVQVAEMHGELVEFNDRLHRVILQKDSVIKRLREELVELRGPVSRLNSTFF